jgi:aryl-alcohol dehydrogenase-like predicted oxidoreductase
MPPDDWRQNDPEFKSPRFEENLRIVDALTEIGQNHGVEPGVVAIAWTLRDSAVSGAIVGARRPSQVEGIFPSIDLSLTDEEKAQLDALISDRA